MVVPSKWRFPQFRRLVFGIGLLAFAVYAAFLLVAGLSEFVQHPTLAFIYEQYRGVTVDLYVRTTTQLFPGDCILLLWHVEGGGDELEQILIADAPVLRDGERQHCDGTLPRIGLQFSDGDAPTWSVPTTVRFDGGVATVILVLAWAVPSLAAIAGARLIGVGRWRLWNIPLTRYAALFVLAATILYALDWLTNSLNIYRYVWDHYHYIDMAEHGLRGNPNLVAPFAYRPLAPYLAGIFANVSGRSVVAGFRLLAYGGLALQLVLVYALARQLTRKMWVGLVVTLIVALNPYHGKFYLFDIFRPDTLAYAPLLLATIALIRRERAAITAPVWMWDGLLILCCSVGLLAREFLLLPAGLLGLALLRDLMRGQRRRGLTILTSILLIGCVSAAYGLPRLLIPVGRSDLLFDVGVTFGELIGMMQRNANLLLSLLIYLLPLLLLLTRERARHLWSQLGGLRWGIGLYVLGVMAFAFIGGTDISRFTPYLLPVLVVTLAILLNDGIPLWQIGYALIAQAVFNRVLSPIPQENLDAYLDYYIVYWERTTAGTQLRLWELVGWFVGMGMLRGMVHLLHQNKTRREALPPTA